MKINGARTFLLAGFAAFLLLGMMILRPSSPSIIQAASDFLTSLDEKQRSQATFPFDDRTREIWHYLPLASWKRAGISLAELSDRQRKKVFNLLFASLSEEGYYKAETIIDLENVLSDLEDGNPSRDPDQYHIAVYGVPADEGVWAYNFEGHHISLHFTFADGKVSGSPTFLGANPAEVPLGPKRGLRVLGDEEDLGLLLINELPPDQQAQAIFRDISPWEIVSSVATELGPLEDTGVRFADMDEANQGILRDLISEYIQVMPTDIAKQRRARIEAAGYADIRFAWAGSTTIDDGHYYRVQGPTFLIEFDNTQNDANHIHTIWRDFKGDFGRDILRAHYHHADADHGHD